LEGDSASTLNEVGGTAKKIISVGGYTSKSKIITWNGIPFDKHIENEIGKRSFSSGTGPTIDGRIKPDIMAPSDMVVGAMNRLAPEVGQTVIWPDTSTTIGRYTRGTGTSVGSPIVAGAIALMLQAKPSLTVDQVRQILQITAIKDQFTGDLTSPDNLWGWGKLDAYGAVANVLGVIPVGTIKSGLVSPVIMKFLSTRQGRMIFLSFRSERPRNIQLEFFSLDGRRALSAPVPKNGLDLPQSLAKGVYFAKLYNEGKTLANQKIAVW
jgi:hypothetical protein